MSYIKNNLLPSEKVIEKVYTSKLILLNPAILAIAIFYVTDSLGYEFLSFVLPIFFFATVYVWSFKDQEIAITTHRFMVKNYWDSKTIGHYDVFLNKIESCVVNKTVLGEIFGYSELCIHGAGGNKTTFKYIKNTAKVRNLIYEAKVITQK